jgi:hypothetical protein
VQVEPAVEVEPAVDVEPTPEAEAAPLAEAPVPAPEAPVPAPLAPQPQAAVMVSDLNPWPERSDADEPPAAAQDLEPLPEQTL